MKHSPIQWCDSTVNPAMGCDGCELWPARSHISNSLIHELGLCGAETALVKGLLKNCGPEASDIYRARRLIGEAFVATYLSNKRPPVSAKRVEDIIAGHFRCYAGILHSRYGGRNRGYAPTFEHVTQFPGRMKEASGWSELRETTRPDKPWLDGLPRLIFVSDMGDLLSRNIGFEYIRDEVITNVQSENGRRHRWLWLSKRPERMARFSTWLQRQGIEWPQNLVAMTSVTSQRTAYRVEQLKGVRSALHGVSVEPLWENLDLKLDGIDWVIVGGESGPAAKPFDLAWCRKLKSQCAEGGIAFFVKQLGRRAMDTGSDLELNDQHGGDWDEWPADFRVRRFPRAFNTPM